MRLNGGNSFVLLLALLAVAQGLFLFPHPEAVDGWAGGFLQVGDTVSAVLSVGMKGQTSLTTGEPTVILAFSSDCAHCDKVASLWRDWTTDPEQDQRVWAISAESRPSAEDYATRVGWRAAVLAVDAGDPAGLERALTWRVPWVFLVDGNGVILAEGHGSSIETISGHLPDKLSEVP